MVVGVRGSGDLVMNDRAKWLKYRGQIQDRNLKVYSDTEAPKRRDVFPPTSGNLPDNAKVRYLGNTYTAKLSFRTGTGGRTIPVYQFFVESKATE